METNKTMETNGNQSKPNEIMEIMETNENQWKPMKTNENQNQQHNNRSERAYQGSNGDTEENASILVPQ